jgi:hypothetical protein
MIKTIRNWYTKNFYKAFGALAVLLTLYFGIYYIPHQIIEARKERLDKAQREVEQSVKELTFSDSTINFLEIKFLIDAREIKLGEVFPLTIPQVITLTQQSFMNDTFLPLAKRKELIKKLEDLKSSLPEALTKSTKKYDGSFNSIAIILSILLSIAIALLGAWSLYKRQKKEEEIFEEVTNEAEQSTVALTVQKHYSYEMESAFVAAIKNIADLEIIDYPKIPENGIGIHFTYRNKYYFVAFKFLAAGKVGLSTVKPIFQFAGNKQQEVWLFYNTDLTAMAQHEIKSANEKFPDRIIKAIKITEAAEFEKVIEGILHPYSFQQLGRA